MRPAICAGHGVVRPPGLEHRVEAGIAVDLEDPGVTGQMRAGMFASPVSGVAAHEGRRPWAAEGAIITHVIPDTGDLGLVFGKEGNRGVVGVEPLGGQHMGIVQQGDRPERGADGTDLIGERREAQGDPFRLQSVALAIERLMQSVFLEDEICEKVRTEHAPGRHVEGRRCLADLLALAARDLLAHGTDDLVAGGHLLKRFRDVGRQVAQFS